MIVIVYKPHERTRVAEGAKGVLELTLGLFFDGTLNNLRNAKLLILLLTLSLTACKTDNKRNIEKDNKMDIEKFEWHESKSAAPGYPIEVYRGGLKRPNGGFTSLFGGLTTGKHGWGTVGDGMSKGVKTLPNGLHVKWVSYAEDCVYEIDTPIDYAKLLALFKKGYHAPTNHLKRTEPFKYEYRQINVGFAPGGVVIVWVTDGGRRIEIGRYQGHKIRVSEEEISQLDPPDQLMFNKEHRQRTMKDIRVVPQEIQEAHKGKPIPYGRWDSLRTRYRWKIKLELPTHIKSKEFTIFNYNGEMENLFGEFHLEQFEVEEELKWNSLRNRSVPKKIGLRWFNKAYESGACSIKFSEKEVFKGFEEVFKDTPEGKAQLEIRVNQIETNAAIKLVGNGKEVRLPNTKVKVFD